MKDFKLINNNDIKKIDANKLKALSPERQIKAIRMWTDHHIKRYGPCGGQNTDKEMQDFIYEAGQYFKLYVDNPSFQAALKNQKGWGTVNVMEGSRGKVTQDLWDILPDELQKRLDTVLSTAAPPQKGQGVKSLKGSPKYKGVAYNYELKFLGQYGDHRCYGNMVGNKVEFSVYDPNGSLH